MPKQKKREIEYHFLSFSLTADAGKCSEEFLNADRFPDFSFYVLCPSRLLIHKKRRKKHTKKIEELLKWRGRKRDRNFNKGKTILREMQITGLFTVRVERILFTSDTEKS